MEAERVEKHQRQFSQKKRKETPFPAAESRCRRFQELFSSSEVQIYPMLGYIT